MRWSEVDRWYRISVAIVQILILIMIFYAIYPVATGGIAVKDIGKETWHYDGKKIEVIIPVTIENDGTYNINNMMTSILIKNESAEFVSNTQFLGNISHGTTRTMKIIIPIDLQHIYDMEYPHFYHFFHSDKFNVTFTLSLKYLMNTVTMSTIYRSTMNWQPIIRDFSFGTPQEINREGDKITVKIPYMIETASYLWGNASFSGVVQCEAFSGSISAKFPLGKEYHGDMIMSFNSSHLENLITHSQDMRIAGKIAIAGISIPVSTNYYWGAPLNNLKVEVLNNGTVHYQFENDASFSMNLHIDKKYYYKGELVKEETETLHVASGARVNRYEPITISSPVDKVVITIYDNDRGVYYQKVITP